MRSNIQTTYKNNDIGTCGLTYELSTAEFGTPRKIYDGFYLQKYLTVVSS